MIFLRNLASITKNRYNDNSGSIYLMALLTLTIIYIVMMVFLQKISLETKTVKNTIFGLQAFYVATAGLEDTVYELRKAYPPGPYFAAVNGWTTVIAGNPATYSKQFPGTHVVPAEYQGTYNITIAFPGTIDDMVPSTFSITVKGDRAADGFTYSRSLYVEGVWTLNKESVYITKVSEI